MIQIIVKLSTALGQTAEVIRTLRALEMAIQSVQGLVCSHIYKDAEAPNSLLYVEEWRATEYLTQEAVVIHFQRIIALMEMSTETPVLRVATLGDAYGIERLSMLMRSQSGAARPDPPDAMRHVPPLNQPDGGSL